MEGVCRWWGPGAGTAVGGRRRHVKRGRLGRHLGQVSTRTSSSEPRGGARALGGVRSPDPRPQSSSLKGASAGRRTRAWGRVTPWGRERAASGRRPQHRRSGPPCRRQAHFPSSAGRGTPHFSTQLEWGWKPAPKIRPGSLLTAPPSPAIPRLKTAPSAAGQPLCHPERRPRSADWRVSMWPQGPPRTG